jgi:hypothetical protein
VTVQQSELDMIVRNQRKDTIESCASVMDSAVVKLQEEDILTIANLPQQYNKQRNYATK